MICELNSQINSKYFWFQEINAVLRFILGSVHSTVTEDHYSACIKYSSSRSDRGHWPINSTFHGSPIDKHFFHILYDLMAKAEMIYENDLPHSISEISLLHRKKVCIY